jgi:hypothetical protein
MAIGIARKTTGGFSVCAFLLGLSGCGGFGETIDYSGKRSLELQGILPTRVAVVVQDERPYVVDESHSKTFVGVSRSLMGIPYSIHTSSNKNFADDFADIVRASLESEGSAVDVLPSVEKESEEMLISRVREPGRVALIFKLNDWKTDTYFNTSFNYDIELKIIDGRGVVAAKTQEIGDREVSSSEGSSDPSILGATEEVLEDLINAYRVQGALGGL